MATDDARREAHRAPGEGEVGCPFHRWREDFPIQWENDHYVTRRELTKYLTLGSALLVGANGVIALLGHAAAEREWPAARVAAAAEVAPGSSLLFRYPTDEDPCILVRDEEGAFRAYSQVCTHLSCAVVYRPGQKILFCPCHQGVFTVSDGVPTAGPPTRPLPRIRLEQRGEEIFAVGVDG